LGNGSESIKGQKENAENEDIRAINPKNYASYQLKDHT
jgi:hypothetical protein